MTEITYNVISYQSYDIIRHGFASLSKLSTNLSDKGFNMVGFEVFVSGFMRRLATFWRVMAKIA